MVQKQPPPRQEQNIHSPYYYPSFSRYNYPSKVGGDEEVYTEPKFSFPHWDDEVSGYTQSARLLRRRASSPSFYEVADDFNQDLKSSSPSTCNQNNDHEDGEATCDEIQTDIELARRDQKTDYDQFRRSYSILHDDIRALQREIEAFEAVCMASGWDLTKEDDDSVQQSEQTAIVTGSLMAAVPKNPGRPATLSATAAARGLAKSSSCKNRTNRAWSFSGTQERVHQTEWIRC